MDSFEALIGKNINEVVLNESTTFFIAPLEYFYKNCGKRYPASKFKMADLDYFNLIEFSQLFKYKSILIIGYCNDIIADLELYYLINDFDVLFDDYYIINKHYFTFFQNNYILFLTQVYINNNVLGKK